MTGQKNRFKTTEKLWDLDDKQLKTPKHDAMVLWLMDENNLKPLLKPLVEFNTYKGFFKRSYESDEIILDDFNVDSERPLFSSKTFIAGYADLIVSWNKKVCLENYPCPIPKEWIDKIKGVDNIDEMESLLREYTNNNKFIMEKKLKERYYYLSRDVYYYDEKGNQISFYNYDKSKGHSKQEQKTEKYHRHSYDADEDNLKLLDFALNILGEIPVSEDNLETWIKSNEFFHKYNMFDLDCLIEIKPYIDSFGAVLRQIKSYDRFWHRRQYSPNYICLFTLDDRFDNQFESQGIKVLHPPEEVTIEDMLDMYGLR